MLSLSLELNPRDFLAGFARIPDKIPEKVSLKMAELVRALREKVEENLSGKVLNIKSGALVRSLHSGTERIGSTEYGFVEIVPPNETVKQYALAHEYGGKGYYAIVPVNKSILKFIGKSGDIVFAHFVHHPPAAEQSYLRSALAEMRPMIVEGLEDALFDAIYGES